LLTTVFLKRTTFEKAVEESCGLGSTPILVYATDRALEEPLDPLSDPLKVSGLSILSNRGLILLTADKQNKNSDIRQV
jgi:hypothetical protein